MLKLATVTALLALTTAANAQYEGQFTTNPYQSNRVNPYQSGGSLYSSDGQYRGNANSNRYDPNSVSNPYGQYGSRYSPDSINNPYGAGSRYRSDSPNNPYGEGLRVCGIRGCD